jgi:glycosyltransferase involved in cell wall biosynthesis
MRIAHVTDCYLPRLGGIEMQVHDLAAHQIAAGHDVRVLTPERQVTSSSIDLNALRDRQDDAANIVVPVTRFHPGIATLPTPATRGKLHALIREGGFDAVHVHSSVGSPFSWVAAQIASPVVPTVVTMHSMIPPNRTLLKLSSGLLHWRHWPVVWTAVSDVAADPLRLLLGADAVSVLPNGITPHAWRPPFPPSPSKGGLTGEAKGELTIVSVMRLAQRKRPMALVRILADIRAAIPAEVPLRAILIGEGARREQLERALRREGMQSWVHLTGRLSREQIRPILWQSDVFLAPAEKESFGIAALEARCAGLPVIAMARGGVGEFVRHGREGFLVASDAEMAQVTAALLRSVRLRVMQKHNRTSMPDLTWSKIVTLSEGLYRRAGAPAPRRLALRGSREHNDPLRMYTPSAP